MGSPCVDRHQSRWSLGFRNVLCEDGDDAYAAAMCCHHHSQSLIFAYVKFRLQNRDDEIAGGKIVIDQDDLVETRAFDLYLICDFRLGDDVGHWRHRSLDLAYPA